MRRRLAAAIAIGVGGAGLVALVTWFGARQIGAEVLRAAWTLPPLLALHAVQLWLSALAWRRSTAAGIGIGAWLRIRWIREAVNSLLPVAQVGGAMVGVRLLTLRGLGFVRAASGTTLDMTVEAVGQLLFTLAGVLALALLGAGASRPWFGGIVLLSAAGTIGLILAQRAGMLRLLEWVVRKMGAAIPALSPDAARGLHADLMHLEDDRAGLLVSLGLHVLAWVLGIAETWFALAAMGWRCGALQALAVESLGMAARSAGFLVPGALGVQEGGFLLVGGLVGLPPDAAIALSMVKRARELMVGAPGLLAWQWSEGTRLLRPAKPGQAAGRR